MRVLPLLFTLLFLSPANLSPQVAGRQKPPGIPDADQQVNQPIEPPMQALKKRIDKDQVRQEADQLRKLADTLPVKIDQVTKGQLPKDLGDNLKQIERLAKHLHSEITP
jgi:hypothetical protein